VEEPEQSTEQLTRPRFSPEPIKKLFVLKDDKFSDPGVINSAVTQTITTVSPS